MRLIIAHRAAHKMEAQPLGVKHKKRSMPVTMRLSDNSIASKETASLPRSERTIFLQTATTSKHTMHVISQ